MKPNKTILVLASLAWIAVMFVLLPWLIQVLGMRWGFLALFCIYWFGFCLPLGLWFQGAGKARQALMLKTAGHSWVPFAVLAQIVIVAAVSLMRLTPDITGVVISLSLLFAVLNGFSEEFFWRGAYLAHGPNDPWFQVLGVSLFTLWHVPLYLGHSITSFGGPVALIGGALGLGAFWAVIAYLSKRIGWSTFAHIGTNAFVFIELLNMNFV